MLGSLARKLRVLGFDTAYYAEGDDSGLLELCLREGRVLITSDRALAAQAASRSQRALLVEGRTDSARIAAIARAADASGLSLVRGGLFCTVCDGALRRVERREVIGLVPSSVWSRHRAFYICSSCGKLYWKGSHWKKLRWLGRKLSAN